ncbi:single-stranded DNA-binding protein [Streptococcus plurextorum]|uniref:single-stranded DNA-binding protein n=1 Tax=Streptococcus plurextorum TaxID=456876 RepID=UPI000419D4F4
MINNVVLVGRLTRDVELRYTPNNVAVGAFNILEKRDNSANYSSMDEQMPPGFSGQPMDITDDDLPF